MNEHQLCPCLYPADCGLQGWTPNVMTCREGGGSASALRVSVWAKVLSIPGDTSTPICVDLIGPGRSHADVKYSAWAEMRLPLQRRLSPGTCHLEAWYARLPIALSVLQELAGKDHI